MSGQRISTQSDNGVLIAGGGLVGLTAALVLRHHGVPVTLVERRAATSPQPKARRLHMRSMEIFRELGLAAAVHAAARDLAGHDHMAAGRTLAEARQLPLWQPAGPTGPAIEASPELPCLIAQDLLEPVLRAAAQDAGARVRFSTELAGFTQTAEHVSVRLLDCGSGEHRLQVRYLVAADGARSPVREALGITRTGPGALGQPMVSVYFRADLGGVVRGREFNLLSHPIRTSLPTRNRSPNSRRPAGSAPAFRTAGWTGRAPGPPWTWPAPAGHWSRVAQLAPGSTSTWTSWRRANACCSGPITSWPGAAATRALRPGSGPRCWLARHRARRPR